MYKAARFKQKKQFIDSGLLYYRCGWIVEALTSVCSAWKCGVRKGYHPRQINGDTNVIIRKEWMRVSASRRIHVLSFRISACRDCGVI